MRGIANTIVTIEYCYSSHTNEFFLSRLAFYIVTIGLFQLHSFVYNDDYQHWKAIHKILHSPAISRYYARRRRCRCRGANCVWWLCNAGCVRWREASDHEGGSHDCEDDDWEDEEDNTFAHDSFPFDLTCAESVGPLPYGCSDRLACTPGKYYSCWVLLFRVDMPATTRDLREPQGFAVGPAGPLRVYLSSGPDDSPGPTTTWRGRQTFGVLAMWFRGVLVSRLSTHINTMLICEGYAGLCGCCKRLLWRDIYSLKWPCERRTAYVFVSGWFAWLVRFWLSQFDPDLLVGSSGLSIDTVRSNAFSQVAWVGSLRSGCLGWFDSVSSFWFLLACWRRADP